LNYYSRIWQKDYFTPSSPQINCPIGTVLGTEFKPVTKNSTDYNYTIPLTAERTYSTDARAYDGLIYSECSVSKDSNETPFNPSCSDLGFYNNLAPKVYNTPAGKTTVLFDINCNKYQKVIDNKWVVSLMNVFVRDSSEENVSVSSFIPVVDCNSDLQSSKVVFDNDFAGSYQIDFNYGGVYNGNSLWCTSSPIEVNVLGNGGVVEPDNLGLVIKDVVIKGNLDGTMDVNFGLSAALATQVTAVDVFAGDTPVGVVFKRPSVPFDVPLDRFLDVSSRFASNEPRAYSLTITYKGGYVGGGLVGSSDELEKRFLLSSVGSDVVHFDDVPNPERKLTVVFVLTADGNAVFTPEEITAIPDSSPILAIMVLIVAVCFMLIKRK
jgi:hypothetical protein